jgi:hypothetical protein
MDTPPGRVLNPCISHGISVNTFARRTSMDLEAGFAGLELRFAAMDTTPILADNGLEAVSRMVLGKEAESPQGLKPD